MLVMVVIFNLCASTSVINGEKAAFHSQVFSEKRERTMDLLIKDMYMDYLNDIHKVCYLYSLTGIRGTYICALLCLLYELS